MPLILAIGRLREEDHGFMVIHKTQQQSDRIALYETLFETNQKYHQLTSVLTGI